MENVFVSETTPIKVEFYDVDAMNVVWHGNYVKFLEAARCALLDKIGYGYKEMVRDGYAFPIATMNLKYIRSLLFAEKAVVKTYLVEYENRIKIKYEIYNEKGELSTKAETTQMALNLKTHESEFECPKRFVELVKKFSDEQKG